MTHSFNSWKDAMSCAAVLTRPIKEPASIKKLRWRPPERVVNSDVKWKPIDKTAALVISRAPEWAKPPIPEPIFVEAEKISQAQTSHTQKPEQRKEHRTMKHNVKSTNNPMLDGKHEDMSDAELNMEITRGTSKYGKESVEAAETLVERAKEATAAMEYIANHFQKNWTESSDLLTAAIGDLRGKRFAAESETKQILGAFADVRRFFLDDRHETEVRRLAEFVGLCERLKVLKDSGFIDRIADTMLTLSIGKTDELA
jgi:hypothetical protein